MNLPSGTEYAGYLPPADGKPPKEDRVRAKLFLDAARRDFPTAHLENRFLLSQQYVGTQYVGIQRTGSWLGGSTVVVECRRDAARQVRKANTPGGLGNDERYHPIEPGDELGDRLAELFEDINSVDTFQSFIWKLVIQDMLTGYGHVWLPPNDYGRPVEMHVLPSVCLQPMFQYVSPDYPFGGYRLNPTYGLSWGGIGIPANVLIPRQEVLVLRSPHPFVMNAGYGPTQALAKQIDVLNACETSRVSSFASGLNPSALLAIDGLTPDQAREFSEDINKSYAGADKHGRIMIVGAGSEGKSSLNMLGQTPKDMDYPAGWEQSVRAVLAGYGVPSVVAGMIDANYAEFWAALRAWEATTIGPWATRFGADFTKHVAKRFYGRQYRVRLIPPKINDPDLIEQQISTDVGANAITVNEIRMMRDRPPLEGGDVPPAMYAVQQQAAMGIGPDGQPLQAGPGADGDSASMSDHPLNAVGDEILKALGVPASNPGSDPFGGDDDQDTDTDSSDPDDGKPFGKAFGNRFEESKHKRDAGKFSSTGGAGASSARPSAGQRGSAPTRATLPPAAANHPKVRSALQHLASKAGEIAQRLNAAMIQAQMKPEDVLGSQEQWETYFLSANADPVAHALGVDVQTAAAILSRLIAHAVQAVKPHLKGGGSQQPEANRPGLARPGQNGDTGVPRPDNPHGEGSLPGRMKAFGGVPELDAFLETLV